MTLEHSDLLRVSLILTEYAAKIVMPLYSLYFAKFL